MLWRRRIYIILIFKQALAQRVRHAIREKAQNALTDAFKHEQEEGRALRCDIPLVFPRGPVQAQADDHDTALTPYCRGYVA